MKKTRTKVLSLVMGLIFVMSAFLTGCGGKKAESTSTGARDTLKDDESKPYEIVWYTIGTPPKDTEKVEKEVNKYLKDKINATVKMKFIDWGDYDKKMQVIVNSGDPFDLCFTCSWANNYVQNSIKGAFLPLDKLMDKYGQDMKKAINPTFLEGNKVNGKTYAIPANKELGQSPVWTFNKKYLDKYNLDISKIQSVESLEPLLKKIKENESGEVIPFKIAKDFTPFLPFDYIINDHIPFGVKLDSKDYKVVNIWETEECLKTLETIHKYYKDGYITKEAATIDTTTGSKEDKNGNWFISKADAQPYADLLWSRSMGYPIVSRPVTDNPIVFNSSCSGSMQAISKTSKNPARVMKFLNLLNTDSYLRNLVDKGIEDVHYKKVEDKVIKDLPARKNYEVASFSIGNEFILYTYEDEPKDKWQKFQEFNADSVKAPLLGFNFDMKPVKTEIAAVKNVADEFQPTLYTGTVDPKEYLPKAVEKLKAAGADKIIAEMQKQIDDWAKKNNKK